MTVIPPEALNPMLLSSAGADPRIQALYRQWARPPRPASKFLFWVPGGLDLILEVESAMAVGLKLRGAQVHAVICDGTYTACIQREYGNPKDPRERWGERCRYCRKANTDVLVRAGIEHSFIGDHVSPETLRQLRQWADSTTLADLGRLDHRGSQTGRHVLSALTRYLQGRPFDEGLSLIPEFAFAALVCAEASANALGIHKPDRVLMSHCTYADWGPALFTAVASGVPVTGWRGSYLKSHIFLQHFTSLEQLEYCHLSPGAWRPLARAGLTTEQNDRLARFLRDRYERGAAHDVPHLPQMQGRLASFRERYAIPRDKPVWGILTHILWDAVNDYFRKAYPDFHTWTLETVRCAIANPQVHWLVKIHPAESVCNPEDGAQTLLRRTFPNLPDHVQVVPYSEDLSLPEFFQTVDGIVSTFSTGSLEIAASGKPTILAGECHFSGKGFTLDRFTADAYAQTLAQAQDIGPLSPRETMLARCYCYSLFLQRQIPFPVIFDPANPYFRFRLDLCERLAPGDPLSDFLFQSILEKRECILGEELMPLVEDFREFQNRSRSTSNALCA